MTTDPKSYETDLAILEMLGMSTYPKHSIELNHRVMHLFVSTKEMMLKKRFIG